MTNAAILHAIFQHAHDAILIADDARRYVDANPAAAALLGLSREQVVGRKIDDFVAVESARVAQMWSSFLASGDQRGRIEIRRSDGTRTLVDFRARASILPGRHLSVLRDVVEGAADGDGASLDRDVDDLLARGRAISARARKLDVLTPRELEVLRHVAEGRTSGEIASQLGISARTVETHRKNMMEKLAVRSVVGLTRFAIRHGVVALDADDDPDDARASR